MVNRVVTTVALAAGGYILARQLMKSRGSDMHSTVEESIEVNVPVSKAYNQWTQFEDFPQFMDSVHEVRQLDDKHLHWRASVAGKEKEWDVEITEQIPDDRIAWRSTGGVHNAGVVTFHRISDSRTRIMLQMDYDPSTIDEKIGDALGFVKMQTKSNLRRFKNLVEQRGTETGAWRGTIPQH
ncbi:SRPBCC family protein [Noviherbaspirillum massiliense]|uniref:SRPBCC family protein n=1 Tax=Noviherbaspirillum massiliense TaxID=1465823 RepID=UPI0011DDB6E3|nr:SRPBCC family protein [Noviherbaspirillum massiliense]